MQQIAGRSRLVGLLVAALALVLLAPAPARAEIPDPYFEALRGPDLEMSDGATPIVGHFTDLLLDDIIWYRPGAGGEVRWTPCPGCPSRFTSSALATQVQGSYTPLVGDFAGNGLDDIYWWADRGGADFLWINNGAGVFTTKRLDMVDGPWRPIVLNDSDHGDSKDDILWQPGTRRSAPLWVFPDDGTGAARTVARPTIPDRPTTVGDFDGDGTADLFFYDPSNACPCPQPGPAALDDHLWRRTGGESGTFAVTTTNVRGEYAPIAGQFDGDPASADDILWFGMSCDGRSCLRGGPDALWAGTPDGAFRKLDATLPQRLVLGPVLDHDGYDAVLVADLAKVSVWTPSAATANTIVNAGFDLPQGVRSLVVGRFISASRSDVYVYAAGDRPEVLYHPRG